jgi:hypothetical protein
MRGAVVRVGCLLLCAVCGGSLLLDGLRQPVNVKIALGMVGEAPDPEIERATLPAWIREEARFLRPGATWEQIVAEAGRRFPGPTGAQLPSTVNLQELIAGAREGSGTCNRMAEALLVLCAAAGRPCREWASVAHPQPPGTGHSVVDVWLDQEEHWANLDIYLGVWASDTDGRPLSTAGFRDTLREDPARVRFVPLAGRKLPTADLQRIYGDPQIQRVEVARNHPEHLAGHWTRGIERIHAPAGQLLQWLVGVGPVFVIPEDPEYARLREDLLGLRRRSLAGAGLLALALLGLALESGRALLRAARPRPGNPPDVQPRGG